MIRNELDLNRRVLMLERDAARTRLFWLFGLALFCGIVGVANLMGGATVSGVILLVLSALNAVGLPKVWKTNIEIGTKLKEIEKQK